MTHDECVEVLNFINRDCIVDGLSRVQTLLGAIRDGHCGTQFGSSASYAHEAATCDPKVFTNLSHVLQYSSFELVLVDATKKTEHAESTLLAFHLHRANVRITGEYFTLSILLKANGPEGDSLRAVLSTARIRAFCSQERPTFLQLLNSYLQNIAKVNKPQEWKHMLSSART